MPPRAVLFDFDGVIADTENVHVAAWEQTFALMGWEVPPEVCARAAEEDDCLFLESVFAEQGVDDGDLEGWLARKQSLSLAMLTDCPRLYPGVIELVRTIQGRFQLAVVTGTWRENVTTVLKSAGLDAAFPLIVAKEDVSRAKPHPEPYRLALIKMKVRPGEAVALEDSPTGMASARGAGIRAVAIGHRRPRGEWIGESAFLDGFEDLNRAVEFLGKGS